MGVTSSWCYPQGHHARRPPTTVPCDRPSSLKLDLNRRFFSLCDLEKKYGNSYYVKLCSSFQIHQWIQTWVTVRKRSIWVKIGDIWSRVTLEFDGWPWKTTGYLFYTTSSFVHHFIAIGEFKLELQSGDAQFRSKSASFCPVWPWNLTDDLEKQKGTSPRLLQALCIIS